ncbi:MAG: ral stress protein [Verrucomicrobiaceae bacterium]|nr:ral stress protein [Verrucomicrobiaceae bacterium]
MTSKTLDLNELWKKIGQVKTGMFTTTDGSGRLNSRPMTSQEVDVDGVLWFFCSLHSEIAHELSERPQVNISFAEPKDGFYVSLAGQATLVRDRGLYASLWNPLVKAWFPRGLDDPDLVLIRFDIESAEYWDADSSRMVQLIKMAKAAVIGKKPDDMGKHGNIKM